jgi:nucleotide-binding universal stress UspA family protein
LAFSTLLASLRFDRPNADLLSVVRDTAARYGSAVIGVVAKQTATRTYTEGSGLREPHEHDAVRFMELASAAETEFRKALSQIESLDWRTQLTFGPAYEHVANEARSADLVIAPLDQRDPFSFPSGQAEVGDLLTRLGRPILAVPAGAAGLALNQVMICWKDTREARRAVADALPLLKASKRVHLVEVAEARGVEDSRRRLADLGAWLARHGVQSDMSAELVKRSEAQQLAAVARNLGADLIVAGGFGRSPLREWAFGGVTRDLLLRADCCVLASH